MRPKNLLIECYGAVYSLNRLHYKKFCQDRINGKDPILGLHYGREIGIIDANVTDWREEEFQQKLNELKGQ